MRSNTVTILIVFSLLLSASCLNKEDSRGDLSMETNANIIDSLIIQNILRDSIALTDGIEVIISYLEIPDSTTLPLHYHPGEEFAYIIEGSGELLLKDQSKTIVKAGDACKVPLNHIHTFSTTNEGAKMVVFRVHEKGKPDRILVE